jgi:hypothetical protein
LASRNRQQIVSRAIQARKPRATGGTTAPRSTARGGTAGLGRGQVAPNPGRLGQARGLSTAQSGPGGSAGAAAPANVAPTPWNLKAEQIVSGAQKSYLNSSANFDLSEQQAKQDFGLDPGFNDYQSNPYSRAALLEQSYKTANRGTMNSAGLQLYSGSTTNRLGANRATYSANRDQLAKTYRDALGEISAGRTKAAEEKAEREQGAEFERIAAAEEVEPEALAAPAGGGKPKKQQRKKQTQQAVANARAVSAPKRRR